MIAAHRLAASLAFVSALLAAGGAAADTAFGIARDPRPPALVRATIAALVQPITYNRFGSHNPHGMIYALLEDLVEARPDAAEHPVTAETARPGRVRLRGDLRPRPLVLRANVGDELEITLLNLLPLDRAGAPICRPPAATAPGTEEPDWPATCRVGFSVIGLEPSPGQDPAIAQGAATIAQGDRLTVRFRLTRTGAHLMLSHGAPAGGQGDGGSLVHGLFGAVIVAPEGSRQYRSQTTREVLRLAQTLDAAGRPRPDRPWLDYERIDPRSRTGRPLLTMHACVRHCDGRIGRPEFEIRHGDLNAIVWERAPGDTAGPLVRARRDFTVIFHDELKTVYAERAGGFVRPFAPLAAAEEAREGAMLAGVRDGFGVNYGASGMGTALIANRLGFGPAAQCVECAYEEFFLSSWANGDPALLRHYADDPANVHHSYLGDRVVFHNLHAGPKETHVFHLHAHQWRGGKGDGGAYLDSQTIAPLQAFSYEVDHGGAGNINLSPGDAIFHCHLYPHFAQGMWALWRIHDVLEQGERRLPDGEYGPGTDPRTGETHPQWGVPIPAVIPLPGQAMPPEPDYAAGRPGFPFFIPGLAGHRAPQPPLDMADDGGLPRHLVRGGTRTLSHVKAGDRGPADPGAVQKGIAEADFTSALEIADIVLLPPEGTELERRAMAYHGEGAPERIALLPDPGRGLKPTPVGPAEARAHRERGLRVVGGWRRPTPERAADAQTEPAWFLVNGRPPRPGAAFADPCMLAPENDPPPGPDYVARLRAWLTTEEGRRSRIRLYEVSAIELAYVVNHAGWYDPQGRINVLTAEAERWEQPAAEWRLDPAALEIEGPAFRDQVRRRVAPFFFRAHSGDCIIFVHQNRSGHELLRDDFQVWTPTDTIGQHIHLVKFDVLTADGSANGWNYEDGTFARWAIIERLLAAARGRLIRADGTVAPREEVEALARELGARPQFQRTIQRWWADPHHRSRDSLPSTWLRWCDSLDPAERATRCRDATLGTVFTHDHFGPSSIQQHGFYSALLIEPAGSLWYTPDGQRLCDDALQEGPSPCLPPVTQLDPARLAFAPTAQAFIRVADEDAEGRDRDGHVSGREFPLALADFALLYDPNGERTPLASCGDAERADDASRDRCLPRLAPAALQGPKGLIAWRARHGTPVNRPDRPEAISADHHDPYLINYGHEPLPLRLGAACARRDNPTGPCREWRAHWDIRDPAPDVETQGTRRHKLKPSNPAHVFSRVVHGDPFTEILHAYQNEHVQIRLIQGAQEVQHVFAVQGLAWFRDIFGQRGPGTRIGAQEIGISEHFAFGAHIRRTGGADRCSDRFFSVGSLDGIWNGAWGLIRTYADRVAYEDPNCGGLAGALVTPPSSNAVLVRTPEEERERRVRAALAGRPAKEMPVCPDEAPRRHYVVEAVEQANLSYNRAAGIRDPWGLRFRAVEMKGAPSRNAEWTETVALPEDRALGPLVLRARAGECLEIKLVNRLPPWDEALRPVGEAPLPRITSFNVAEQDPARATPALRAPKERVVRPSSIIALSPAAVQSSPQVAGAGLFGLNDGNAALVPSPKQRGGRSELPTFSEYYLGFTDLEVAGPPLEGPPRVGPGGLYRPFEYGAVPLLAFGDVIHHAVHGLTGALIVLPEGATPDSWTGRQARITLPDGRRYTEMVLVFRDGLNLHAPDARGVVRPLPDCAVCEDSYDFGEKAVNFGTEPFWARLGLRLPGNAETALGDWPALNAARFPDRFLLGRDPATPTMRVEEGEEIVIHVVQPQGRARQRAFTVLGHDYPAPDAARAPADPTDRRNPGFLSPGVALLGPGRSFSARLGPARPGTWVYRDGPTMIFSGGAWGHIVVDPRPAGSR